MKTIMQMQFEALKLIVHACRVILGIRHFALYESKTFLNQH